MQFAIKTKNFDLTDAITTFINEKMEHMAPRLERFGNSVTGEVLVERTTNHHQKGDVFRAEVHVRLPGKLVYADAHGEDLYVAINDARKEAERQISDYKDTIAEKMQEDTGHEIVPDQSSDTFGDSGDAAPEIRY